MDTAIPSQLGKLNKLKGFFAINSGIKGTIPTDLAAASELESIDLSDNLELRGSLPSHLANLKNLTNFKINNCSLTGTLPSNFGLKWDKIKTIDLSNNKIKGGVLFAWRDQVTSFADNDIYSYVDGIDEAFFWREFRQHRISRYLPILRSLSLANNYLDDTIGNTLRAVSTLGALSELDLSGNKLHGTLTGRDVTEMILENGRPQMVETYPSLVRLVLDNNPIETLVEYYGGSNFPVLVQASFRNTSLRGEFPTRYLVPILDVRDNPTLRSRFGMLPDGCVPDETRWVPLSNASMCAGVRSFDVTHSVAYHFDSSYDDFARCVCNAGFAGSRNVCKACPLDTYMPLGGVERYSHPNSSSCFHCPPHSSTGGRTGAVSVTDCMCHPGYELTSTQPLECAACPASYCIT